MHVTVRLVGSDKLRIAVGPPRQPYKRAIEIILYVQRICILRAQSPYPHHGRLSAVRPEHNNLSGEDVRSPSGFSLIL